MCLCAPLLHRSALHCYARPVIRLLIPPLSPTILPRPPLVIIKADLEDRKESAQSVFKREVEPLLAAHPDAWPPAACGPAAFEWACCNVQSRAFHLVKQNWITHVQSEGGCEWRGSCVRQRGMLALWQGGLPRVRWQIGGGGGVKKGVSEEYNPSCSPASVANQCGWCLDLQFAPGRTLAPAPLCTRQPPRIYPAHAPTCTPIPPPPAGTDLYLIPGIDMINHSTQPARRSTTLELVEQPLTVRCGDPPRELTLQGYFTMKAGGLAARVYHGLQQAGWLPGCSCLDSRWAGCQG